MTTLGEPTTALVPAGSLPVRESLLYPLVGTTHHEIQALLPLRSRERFRRLVAERTLELLSRDKIKKGFTSLLKKSIADYTVGESIALACYFSRSLIEQYQTLEEGVRSIFTGDRIKGVSGKCTDYTAIALYYLQEYLIPLRPEKFAGWQFGFDRDRIGDYAHCYLKAVQTIDVFFLDPTSLSLEGMEKLSTPEAVVRAASMEQYPLLLRRDAEDILAR